VYNGPEAWTIHIRCIQLLPVHDTFRGPTSLTYPAIAYYVPSPFPDQKLEILTGASLYIQVSREEEFAPVKNANGAAYDTPDTAKLMLLRLHSRWVVAAGGFLTHSVPLYMTGNSLPRNLQEITTWTFEISTFRVISHDHFSLGVEVSPLSSYAGENLEAICRGRTFHAPSEISF
jgi:hypothetical protein